MNKMLIASLLLVSNIAFANNAAQMETISVETFEEPFFPHQKMLGNSVGGSNGGGLESEMGKPDRLERANQVISTAKDFVALGEAIYTLVQKGKPSNVTSYEPVSVVPRDPFSKEIVDPFEMEGFSIPVQKKFTTIIKSGVKEAVKFEYMVMYSYGGSFNGYGKWITNAQIIPISVKTSYGWDFNASMRVTGIMNHGTKADPVAGVILAVKYQMNSWGSSTERNDTFHITGRGEMKAFVNN